MKDAIHLLWTGGWDSTYRLLDLVLGKSKVVQTHYVIDPQRRWLQFEFKALIAIKAELFKHKPEAVELLPPTEFILREDIPNDCNITGQHQRLQRESYIGPQYEWLARFAKATESTPLELCVIAQDYPFLFLQHNLVMASSQDHYSLKPECMGTDLEFFKYFRYPLIFLTKLEMYQAASTRGWLNILEQTWFCHKPLGKGRPCGNCISCDQIIRQGLGYRLSKMSQVRWHFYYQPRIRLVKWKNRWQFRLPSLS